MLGFRAQQGSRRRLRDAPGRSRAGLRHPRERCPITRLLGPTTVAWLLCANSGSLAATAAWATSGECAGRASPPGCRSGRSRVRAEDVGDGSGAEGGGAHRFDGERCGDDPLARARDDRVDDKAGTRRSSRSRQAIGRSVSRPGAGRYPAAERCCLSRLMASASAGCVRRASVPVVARARSAS